MDHMDDRTKALHWRIYLCRIASSPAGAAPESDGGNRTRDGGDPHKYHPPMKSSSSIVHCDPYTTPVQADRVAQAPVCADAGVFVRVSEEVSLGANDWTLATCTLTGRSPPRGSASNPSADSNAQEPARKPVVMNTSWHSSTSLQAIRRPRLRGENLLYEGAVPWRHVPLWTSRPAQSTGV